VFETDRICKVFVNRRGRPSVLTKDPGLLRWAPMQALVCPAIQRSVKSEDPFSKI